MQRSPSLQKNIITPSASNILSDDDFLSSHLGSLLVRQPDSSTKHNLTASTSALQRSNTGQSNGQGTSLSSGREYRRSSHHSVQSAGSSSSSRKYTITTSVEEIATPRSPSASNSMQSPQTPVDGVFGALFSHAPMQTPTLNMINAKSARSISNTDYFDRVQSTNTRYNATSPSAHSGTFTTSFGRRRPSQKRSESGSTCSTQSRDLFDSVGEVGSSDLLSRRSSIDRRASDVTQSSTQSSIDTGISTPLSCSDGLAEGLKSWPEGDDEEAELEEEIQMNSIKISRFQNYEMGDRTKWTRFQEGESIEPPEEVAAAAAAAQLQIQSENTLNMMMDSASAAGRYTSMTSARFSFSNRETVKANSRLSISKFQGDESIALIPFGDDGRTFRFISATTDS